MNRGRRDRLLPADDGSPEAQPELGYSRGRQCGALLEIPETADCPRCGSAELNSVDDLLEAALQQAFDRKAGGAVHSRSRVPASLSGDGPLVRPASILLAHGWNNFAELEFWDRLFCHRTPEGVHRCSKASPRAQPNLLLEDLAMGRISTFVRRFSRGFDHLLNSLDRRSSRLLFSTRRFGRAYLKRVPQLRSRLRSLASKVARWRPPVGKLSRT